MGGAGKGERLSAFVGKPAGQFAGLSFAIDTGERGGAGESVNVGGLAVAFDDDDLVLVIDLDAAAGGDADTDFDQVVVEDGPAVSGVELDDNEKGAGGFHLGVGDSRASEELGAGDLEPGEVGGVVGDAHGVALAVSHADGHGAAGWDGRGGCWIGVGVHRGRYADGVAGSYV